MKTTRLKFTLLLGLITLFSFSAFSKEQPEVDKVKISYVQERETGECFSIETNSVGEKNVTKVECSQEVIDKISEENKKQRISKRSITFRR